MDLLLVFLRLLLGLPAESSEPESVVVRPDGRTSGLRRRAVDDACRRDEAGWEKLRELFEFHKSGFEPDLWQSLSRTRTGNVERSSRDSLMRRSRRD